MASPALRELVTSEAPYLTITDADKVVCRINGHTMPPNMEVIEAFVRCVLAAWAGRKMVGVAICERTTEKGD